MAEELWFGVTEMPGCRYALTTKTICCCRSNPCECKCKSMKLLKQIRRKYKIDKLVNLWIKETNWEIVCINKPTTKQRNFSPFLYCQRWRLVYRRSLLSTSLFAVLDDKEDIFDHSDALQVSEDTSESVFIKILYIGIYFTFDKLKLYWIQVEPFFISFLIMQTVIRT